MDNLGSHPGMATVVKADDPASLTRSSPSGWQLLIHDNEPPLGNGSFGCVFRGVAHFNGRQVDVAVKKFFHLENPKLYGLMDAAVSVVFEHRRPPTEQSPHWLDRWDGKIRRAVATLDAEHARQPLELGRLDGIAAAAALAYLDFRLPELDWHDASPGLAAWWLETAQCPCVVDTAPPA